MPPVVSQRQIQDWLPKRSQTAHKGDFGRVLIVAGSRSMCGAGLLCAQSALTAGAGLVYWALPKSMQPSFAAALPEAITLPFPENNQGEIDESAWEIFPEICEKYKPSLLVVGPGMGQSPLLPVLLQNVGLSMIVDADALNALSGQDDWLAHWPQERPCIFTPHALEMARILHEPVAVDMAARQAQVEKLTRLSGGVCLLKGASTLVAAELNGTMQISQNSTGGPALAKGGSGDVLCGTIAGLWAQMGSAQGFSKDTAFKACVCGVYLHGLAGDLAAQTYTDYSVSARALIGYLPHAFKKCVEGK